MFKSCPVRRKEPANWSECARSEFGGEYETNQQGRETSMLKVEVLNLTDVR